MELIDQIFSTLYFMGGNMNTDESGSLRNVLFDNGIGAYNERPPVDLD